MKAYKWFFLIFVSSIVMSCNKTSEEELIGDWQKRALLPESQRSFAATFVIGNEGYIIGGTNGYKTPLNDVLVFNHLGGAKDIRGNSLGYWRPLKDFPGRARQQAVGFSLKGHGYIGTGWALDDKGEENETRRDFWRYDPADDSWVEIAPLPSAAKPRRGAIAFSLKVGDTEYGYVGFGYEDDPGRAYLLDIWRYDPANDEWTPEYGYSGEKRVGAAVFVINNKAFICSGENSIGTNAVTDFWMFDPNADEDNRWTKMRQMANANINEDYDDDYGGLARSFGVAYVAQVGGELRGHIVGKVASNWEYDHGEDLWMQRTKFINNTRSVPREGMISFSFPNTGRAYVGMGKSGISHSDDLWEFVPLDDDYIYDDY